MLQTPVRAEVVSEVFEEDLFFGEGGTSWPIHVVTPGICGDLIDDEAAKISG